MTGSFSRDARVDDGAQPRDPPPTAAYGEGWWTPERAALCRWFERSAPGLAPVYQSAVRMAIDETFPGRVWFVAHAIREIRNRLPDALAGEVAASHTDYPNLARSVHARWVEDGWPADGTRPIDSSSDHGDTRVGTPELPEPRDGTQVILVVEHKSLIDSESSERSPYDSAKAWGA